MKRKIFISINLPARDKKRLIKASDKWSVLPVKWVKEQNLHITLVFLGFTDDSAVEEICAKAKEASAGMEIFDVAFDRIEIGPTSEKQQLIWLTGEPNENLLRLVEKLEKELGIFVSEKKSFRPHITLGRIRQRRWAALPEKPEISEKFPLTVAAETVDVMASEFKNDGQEYTVIDSCPLK